VARAYEAAFPHTEEHLETLAHHYAESLELEKALEFLERAGERAASLDAGLQAKEMWTKARAVADRVGDRAAAERIEGRLRELAAS
jgi:hypothetical protein